MKKYFIPVAFLWLLSSCREVLQPVVFQTDFGIRDAAVAEMKGVALTVHPSLRLFDITHEIPVFNIWEAAYRLNQAAPYWPAGTVFVSVVDPGVGTQRKSVVLKTKSGHYFVSPDNGTLTLVAASLGIDELREINEAVNRRKDSEKSYTFFGRDVYAFTAARLASGKISFEEVGNKLPDSVVRIPFQLPERMENGRIRGNIPILDIQFGNVWTNIPDSVFFNAGWKYGDSVEVQIRHRDSVIYNGKLPMVKTFGEVAENNSLAYFNSLLHFSLAINLGNFSEKFHIGSGPDWSVEIGR